MTRHPWISNSSYRGVVFAVLACNAHGYDAKMKLTPDDKRRRSNEPWAHAEFGARRLGVRSVRMLLNVCVCSCAACMKSENALKNLLSAIDGNTTIWIWIYYMKHHIAYMYLRPCLYPLGVMSVLVYDFITLLFLCSVLFTNNFLGWL